MNDKLRKDLQLPRSNAPNWWVIKNIKNYDKDKEELEINKMKSKIRRWQKVANNAKSKEELEKHLAKESSRMQNEMIKELARRELARRNFKDFVAYVKPDFVFSAFNLDLIEQLQNMFIWSQSDKVEITDPDKEFNFLVVNMPPRHWKTLLINELYPAFVLWNNPTEEFVNAWYASKLSMKSVWRCYDIMVSTRFKNVFPEFEVRSYSWWVIQTESDVYAWWLQWVWVWWSLTWEWMTFWIVDDPTKNRQEAESERIQETISWWYTSTFLTRRQVTRKRKNKICIIIVMTRWHTNDLLWFIESETSKDSQLMMKKVIYKAINDEWQILFPELFSIADYESFRDEVWPRDWAALYQQDPIRSMWDIFKKEYFKYFYKSDLQKPWAIVKKQDLKFYISVDPAFSSSKSSDDIAIWLIWRHKITKEFYVRNIKWWTLWPTAWINEIFSMIYESEIEWIRIEFISFEIAHINKSQTKLKELLVQEMKNRWKYYTIMNYEPKDNKEERIQYTLEPRFQQWMIHFLNPNDNDWNDLYKKLENQLFQFPNANHDDYPDMLEQAIKVWDKKLDKEKWNRKTWESFKRPTINSLTWKTM